MSLFEQLVNSRFSVVVGWMVIHSLWQGAIISAMLAAALSLIRSPRFRYAAACGAMLLIVFSLGFTFVRLSPGYLDSPVVFTATSSAAWNGRPVRNSPDIWAPHLSALAPWLAPFWIAGALLFSLRHVAGFVSLSRLRRRGVCAVPELWQNELKRLSARLKISRPVTLLTSCLADAPMVLGHVRPLILLPLGMFAGFSAPQIEAILLHELAHVRRRDYLVNIFQRVMEALLFYHPAAWWISRVIRAEREKCCDDVVVSISGHAHEYALALAALEENRWTRREPAVAATGGSLVKRIRRLLYPECPTGTWTPLLAVVILAATATIAAPGWRSTPSHRGSTVTPQAQESTSPYSKWLNEDVVYIIDDAERAAFQRLTTDEEREKFIEQFWERRNPTPGSPENAFKEEHYRRIAFANKHFATLSGKPGWQTDRGHIYIVYGPPDEIDSHPKDTTRPVGTEQWRYLHVAGLGDDGYVTFIDRNGGGDYHLAPGK
jgi:GWxTD domain-containing protein